MSTSTDLIVLSSKDRGTNETTSNFSLSLQESLSGTYELTSFSMSNNLYNVVSGENDKIYMEHSVDGANTLTLTPGYYSATTLATEIKTQLDTVSAVVYTVSYSSITGKFTISPNSGNLHFNFATNTTASARYLMGFNEEDGTPAASQTSDNVIELKLHDMLAIKIAQDNNSHVTLTNGTEATFIVTIEQVGFGDVIHYQRNKKFNQFAKFNSSVSTVNIQLLAQDGDILDTNGAEWYMSLKKLF